MILVIFEDGELRLTDDANESLIQSAESGIVDLVDVSVANEPKYYFQGFWHEVNMYDT